MIGGGRVRVCMDRMVGGFMMIRIIDRDFLLLLFFYLFFEGRIIILDV